MAKGVFAELWQELFLSAGIEPRVLSAVCKPITRLHQ